MLSGFWIPVALSQPEVNNVDHILLFTVTDQEIIGFHISVNNSV